MEKMSNNEVVKARPFIVAEIIDYIPNSVVHKSILKKITGNVSVVSIDTCEELIEKASPFDTFIQIIDGKAEILIDGISNLLETGQCIIMPSHSSNTVRARERFKMISITIKSGYE
jgi:quercetin dioxygenase-like cupin family protein